MRRRGEVQFAPLRAVLSRRFVAYEGTHITLACRHEIIRARPTHSGKMRCPECARVEVEQIGGLPNVEKMIDRAISNAGKKYD